MDRFPGEARARRRRWSLPSFGSLGRVDARRIMGGALILMLFAWILRGPWGGGFPWLLVMAGYISLASVVLFVVALVMLVRAGGFAAGPIQRQPRWRGQVIELPRRGGLFASWRRGLRRLFSRFSRRSPRSSRASSGSRGRDSFQW
jgi:hypothetical protein